MVNSLIVHIVLKKGSEVSPKLQLSWSSYEHVRIRSTGVCFNHIFLIRTRNCAPFFCSIPYSSRNIVSNFENFSQPFDWMVNRFVKFFFRRSIGSSRLLANDSVFGIFGALV